MNAPGNRHDLGNILSVWLGGQGDVQIIDGDVDQPKRPKCILISTAMPDRRDHVAAIARRKAASTSAPESGCRGYPVAGLIQAIAGANSCGDSRCGLYRGRLPSRPSGPVSVLECTWGRRRMRWPSGHMCGDAADGGLPASAQLKSDLSVALPPCRPMQRIDAIMPPPKRSLILCWP